MIMNAVGFNVSKSKSAVAVLHPGVKVVAKPFDVLHLSADIQSLDRLIQSVEGESRLVVECTDTMNPSHGKRLTDGPS